MLVPYLEGERTPNRPLSTGALHGLTLATGTPAHLARAAVEGLLCGLADGVDALVAQGARVDRVLLVGGAAASRAVREIAPQVLGRPVVVPPPAEYVALGAARQAAWALGPGGSPPVWELSGASSTRRATPPYGTGTPPPGTTPSTAPPAPHRFVWAASTERPRTATNRGQEGQASASSARVSASSCGRARVRPMTGMKFVSPPHRGHDVLVQVGGDAGAGDRALVHPDVEPVRAA